MAENTYTANLVRGDSSETVELELIQGEPQRAFTRSVEVNGESLDEVWELDLPPTVALVFVIREGRGIVPDTTTGLRAGDDLLLVVPRADREATERRLRAVSRSGRLARFYGDRGEV